MEAKLILLAFLFMMTGVVSQRPDIVDEILPEVKKVGKTGRLNCTVINMDEDAMLTWNLLKEEMIISENEKIVVSLNPEINGERKYEIVKTRNEMTRRTTYMLVVAHLMEEDSGFYTCYVRIPSLRYTEWPLKKGLITVQVPPTIRPGSTSTVVEVDLGESVNLTCAATGIPYPNITWTRADGKLLAEGKGALSRGDVLTLTNITEKDRGLYLCLADNNVAPSARHQAQVLVFFAPIARAVETSVGQAQNKRYNSILACIISGYPVPSLQWSMRTNEGIKNIKDDEKHDISKQISSQLRDGESWYSLKIKNVQANDYTNYMCTGRNNLGQNYDTIELFETMECQGANCPSLGVNAATCFHSSIVLLVVLLGFVKLLLKRI